MYMYVIMQLITTYNDKFYKHIKFKYNVLSRGNIF